MCESETDTRETVRWECVGRAAHFLEDRQNITVGKTKIWVHQKGKKSRGNRKGQYGHNLTRYSYIFNKKVNVQDDICFRYKY